MSDQRSVYHGIGVSITTYQTGPDAKTKDTFVTAVTEGSPANAAGLRFGDKISHVNGKPMQDKTVYEVRDHLRGRLGTSVTIRVERPGGMFRNVRLRRARVPQPSVVDSYLICEKTGYVDLSNGFSYTTAREFNFAIDRLSSYGMKALILDLRDNNGGILEQAVRVAEKFVPSGETIASQRGRMTMDNRSWVSKNRQPMSIPVIVLINEESASAAEVVAGALQDFDRALVVGETSFGKGLVQSVIDLPYGRGLVLTTAKYYTPSGRLIQRDYSGSHYDYYYKHAKGAITNSRRTASGRTVFGGNGITPDVEVKTSLMTEREIDLLDPIFHFSKDLLSGSVPALGRFSMYKRRSLLADEERNVIVRSFANSVGERWKGRLTKQDLDFAFLRIRYNQASALMGTRRARRILRGEDPQIKAAINSVPKARKLATLSGRNFRKARK